MTSPLEGSLARQVNSALQGIFLAATLSRDTLDSSGDAVFDPPAPTTQTYSCRAIVDVYSKYLISQGMVQANERKVLILAQSLTVSPVPGDRVTVQGATYEILDVSTDPATAVWECRSRA